LLTYCAAQTTFSELRRREQTDITGQARSQSPIESRRESRSSSGFVLDHVMGEAAKRLKTEAEKDGAHLPVFLASRSLLPFIANDLWDGPLKPIIYRSGDTTVAGYPAEALPEICNIWLTARQEGAL
jgi:hypothetical protein